jgi:hypothetical protein
LNCRENVPHIICTSWHWLQGDRWRREAKQKNIYWIHPTDLFQISSSSVIGFLGKMGEKKQKIFCQLSKWEVPSYFVLENFATLSLQNAVIFSNWFRRRAELQSIFYINPWCGLGCCFYDWSSSRDVTNFSINKFRLIINRGQIGRLFTFFVRFGL